MLRVGARGNTRAAETAGPLTPEFPISRAGGVLAAGGRVFQLPPRRAMMPTMRSSANTGSRPPPLICASV